MALIFADGFDHYGTSTTGSANMLLGAWASVSAQWTPATTKPRNSLCSMAHTTSDTLGFRRTFGTTLTTVGVAGAFWYTSLPLLSTTVTPIQLLDNAGGAQISVNVTSAGFISVRSGGSTGTQLGISAAQVISAGSWAHIECKWIASSTTSATDGTVEVYVNGTIAVNLAANVDNVATSNREVSQVSYGIEADGAGVRPNYVDDVFAWDTTGSYCNSVIGDKDVLPYYYDGDEATSDWVRNTGASDFSAVNQTAQDGDTTYIEAAVLNDTEELSVAAVPSSVDGIVAVVMVNMLRKTAAGASEVTVSLVESGGAAAAGTAHVMTQSYAYYHDVVHRNPVDGTTAWTYTTLSAAKGRLKRTV